MNHKYFIFLFAKRVNYNEVVFIFIFFLLFLSLEFGLAQGDPTRDSNAAIAAVLNRSVNTFFRLEEFNNLGAENTQGSSFCENGSQQRD